MNFRLVAVSGALALGCVTGCAQDAAKPPAPAVAPAVGDRGAAVGEAPTPLNAERAAAIAREEKAADERADKRRAAEKKVGEACTDTRDCAATFCYCNAASVSRELACEHGKCATNAATCAATCKDMGGVEKAYVATPEAQVGGPECDSYCARKRSLSCYDPSGGSCERECKTQVGCEAQKRAWMKCFGAQPVSAFQCNSKGAFQYKACESELSAFLDCGPRVDEEARKRLAKP